MAQLLFIVVGAMAIYLAVSGKLDCFFAALKACPSKSPDAITPTSAPVTPTAPERQTPQQILDNVLSPDFPIITA